MQESSDHHPAGPSPVAARATQSSPPASPCARDSAPLTTVQTSPASPGDLDSEVPDSSYASPKADTLSGQKSTSPSHVSDSEGVLPDPATCTTPAVPEEIQTPTSTPARQLQLPTTTTNTGTAGPRPMTQETQHTPPDPCCSPRTAMTVRSTPARSAARFASPPITMRRCRPQALTLDTVGSFLAAATKELDAVLPTPGKRKRRFTPNFSPRRGRSAATAAKKTTTPGAAPTAERRTQVHILRTLGFVGINQKISAADMKAYGDLFAAPISRPVLAAMAALLDRVLPTDPTIAPITTVINGSLIEA